MPEPKGATASLHDRWTERHKRACLIAARDYIQRGWALVPIAPGRKTPYTPLLPKDGTGEHSWIPFKLRRATMPEVEAWYDLEPRLNLDVLCGQASGGLIVVDYDRPPRDMPPETVFARTSRGFHAYYTTSREVTLTKFEFGEIRGENKIAVLPPSINSETNRHYSWFDSYSLHDIELASFEDWLRAQEDDKRDVYISTWVPSPLAGKTDISTWVPSLPQTHLNADALRQYASRPEVAAAILEKCGVQRIKLGKAFRCPLPGHRERHPSAALYQTDSGEIIFHDFKNREDQ